MLRRSFLRATVIFKLDKLALSEALLRGLIRRLGWDEVDIERRISLLHIVCALRRDIADDRLEDLTDGPIQSTRIGLSATSHRADPLKEALYRVVALETVEAGRVLLSAFR